MGFSVPVLTGKKVQLLDAFLYCEIMIDLIAFKVG